MYDLGSHLAGLEARPGTNVLVAGPPLVGKRRLGLRALAAADDDEAVVVTTRESAQRVREEYRTLAGRDASPHVIDAVTKRMGRSPAPETRAVASPAALDELGTAVADHLRRCHGGDGRTRVLLDSLTPPLLYSTLQTVFRFVHRVVSRVENAAALGLYTVTATAHEEETLETLTQLFDGRVDVGLDGTATVDLPGAGARTVDL